MDKTTIVTFGENLSLMLKKRGMTVAELATLTNVKSRTTIHRLLKDMSGIDIVAAFAKKLVELDPLKLSPAELDLMYQSVEVNRLGKPTYYARKALLSLFQNNILQKVEKPVQILGSSEHTPITLWDCFEAYTHYPVVNILIFDAPRIKLSETLICFIHLAAHTKISIDQVIDIDDDDGRNADVFLSIYKLINYVNYNAYYLSTEKLPEVYQANSYKDLIVVQKVTEEGVHTTDLIKIEPDMDIVMLSDNPGQDLFAFYSHIFQKTICNAKTVKRIYPHHNLLEKYLQLSDFLFQSEKDCSDYLVKQNMCIHMIHPDILYSMLVDSKFFGLSENHPGIQKLIQITQKRFYNYFHSNKMKTALFTKRGLLDFVKNKELSDHINGFRPFTADEVQFTLEFLLVQINTNPFFNLYLLKDDYFIGNIEYSYHENKAIYLFDSCSGYGDDFEDGILTTEPILKVFEDFLKNELIPNHTLQQSETLAFLEELIK